MDEFHRVFDGVWKFGEKVPILVLIVVLQTSNAVWIVLKIYGIKTQGVELGRDFGGRTTRTTRTAGSTWLWGTVCGATCPVRSHRARSSSSRRRTSSSRHCLIGVVAVVGAPMLPIGTASLS